MDISTVSTDLTARAARLAERAMARLAQGDGAAADAAAGAATPTAAPQQPAPLAPVKLPQWPDGMRGVPNVALRSALFGAIRRGRRTFLQRVPIACPDGMKVLQTGPRLDQADLDVWEMSLHIARHDPLGVRVQFTAHGFLTAIGRCTGKSDHEWLKGAFARLASTVVEITDGQKTYFGPLIHHGVRDDATGQYVIALNPALVAIYTRDSWTGIEWAVRRRLKSQPLAQWLHGFYSTHAAPYAYSVARLRELCGSENSSLRDFRRELRSAFASVSEATGWEWEIVSDDLVRVGKKPTPSQARHLARRPKKHGIAPTPARDSTHAGTG